MASAIYGFTAFITYGQNIIKICLPKYLNPFKYTTKKIRFALFTPILMS